jgi:tetratricopeptide (TPR) repeat protein
MRILLTVLATLWAVSSAAVAGETLERGPAPAWVRTVPDSVPETSAAQAGDAFRFELLDQQFWFDETGWSTFVRSRVALLSPQALAGFGTVALPWNPTNQDVTVHAVNIIRDGQTFDAHEGRSFTVLRRESNLEAAIVDGLLTATLQLDDLRVGDRLEFAYSVANRVRVLGDHAEFAATHALPMEVDRYFLSASWPTSKAMQIRASSDWTAPAVRRRGNRSEIEVSLEGVEPLVIPGDVPLRFHQVRRIEGSDYGSWARVAEIFAPLYAEAARLSPDSPLWAEVERIKSQHATESDRVLAALRMVQDEVRYLALAMGEGGLLPASADETWARRLGDCKGKTALLLALLEALGVEARPVLASGAGEVLDQYLPAVGAFDHVLVQADVEGRLVWLDGTRSGDRSLVALPPLDYGWVLPVQPQGAELVRMERALPDQPLRETRIEVDLTGGLYGASPVKGEMLFRGDSAAELQAQFSVASPAQRDTYLRMLWPDLLEDLKVTQVGSAYDPALNELRLAMSGEITLDWASGAGRRVEIPLSRISWSAGDRRPEGPFRDHPFITNYPGFSRFRTEVVLPKDGEGFAIEAAAIDEEATGYRHRRQVTMEAGRVVMVRETLILRPEYTEAERAAAVEPLRRLAAQAAQIRATTYTASSAELQALESDAPETAAGWVDRSLALSGNGRTEAALEALDRALALDPQHANAYANRGILRFWNGDLEAATEDFDKAAEIDPSERIAMNGRGLVALGQGRPLDAVVEFSMSLRAEPDDLFVLRARSEAYADLESWDKALADVRRLRSLQPDQRQYAFMEGGLLVQAGRRQEAQEVAAALLEKDPDDKAALQFAAFVRQSSGDLSGAEEALTRAIAHQPDELGLLVERAEVRFKRGDTDAGRADLAAVRPQASESAGLLNNLCWTQAIFGVDLDQALADCDAALVLSPKDPSILDSRALVLLHLGRTQEALELYEEALAQVPDMAASLYGRGVALETLGRVDDGRTDKEAAVNLSANVAEAFAAFEARGS